MNLTWNSFEVLLHTFVNITLYYAISCIIADLFVKICKCPEGFKLYTKGFILTSAHILVPAMNTIGVCGLGVFIHDLNYCS